MRHLVTFAFGLLLLAGCGAEEPEAASSLAWRSDWDAALATAKAEDKLLLVNFSGSDWCGWCIKLDNEVFSQPAFAEWVGERFVPVHLDFPRKKEQPEELKQQNRGLLKRYGVQGFPTVLFIDGEGQVVARSGYLEGGPAAWTANADSLLAETAQGE